MCTLGSYGPLRGGGGVMVEQEEGKGGGSYSLFSLILSLPKGT